MSDWDEYDDYVEEQKRIVKQLDRFLGGLLVMSVLIIAFLLYWLERGI